MIGGNCALVPSGGVLGDVDLFDAAFFGYTPGEAEIMDPQLRLFLEYSWKALEAAGYGNASQLDYSVGVYGGVGDDDDDDGSVTQNMRTERAFSARHHSAHRIFGVSVGY